MLKVSLLFKKNYKLRRQIAQGFLGLIMRSFQGIAFI